MSTVSNSLTTTEYTYNKPQAGQGVSEVSAPNSVYTVQQPQQATVEEQQPQTTSKLDELLQKLCEELKNLGLNAEELKNSGILFRITGLNENQIQALTEQELQQVVECLKFAIKDSVVDGKVDLEKVGKLANDYYIAVNTEWTLDGFRSYNNHGKTLFQRLKDPEIDTKGILAKYDRAEDVPPEILEEATFNFFKMLRETSKGDKGQLQTFGLLLINTPDSEKAIFKQAVASLAQKNRLPGLKAVLTSFDTPEARTAWANSWTTQERANLGKADVEGNVPSNEEQTAMNAEITSIQDKEGLENSHKTLVEDVNKVLEKLAKGEELTEDDQQLLATYKNIFGGETLGTALNKVVDDKKWLENQLKVVTTDIYKYGEDTYKEVLQNIADVVKKNPEIATPEFNKMMKEATNNVYSAIAEGKEVEITAPAEPKDLSIETGNEGIVQRSEVDIQQVTQNVETLRQQVILTSEEMEFKFTVEKTMTETVRRGENTLKAKLEGKNEQEKLNFITKNLKILSFGEKWAIGNGLKRLGHQNLMNILSKIPSDSFILAFYKQLGLTLEDIETLKVSSVAKEVMRNELAKDSQWSLA